MDLCIVYIVLLNICLGLVPVFSLGVKSGFKIVSVSRSLAFYSFSAYFFTKINLVYSPYWPHIPVFGHTCFMFITCHGSGEIQILVLGQGYVMKEFPNEHETFLFLKEKSRQNNTSQLGGLI